MTELTQHDTQYMAQALQLAESVLYLTDPNPRVGCVIVRDKHILGQGATQVVGGPHAEIMAIRHVEQRGLVEQLRGSTFYVSLEPCCHYGRTPPCVEAIIRTQAARVVIAMRDPNPFVAGQGISQLREAGIQVELGVLREEALALNLGFVSRMARQRPWVWSKIACSIDGQVALNNGQSQWITGARARADGHHWRACSSVVLSGLGTVEYDNPSLNVRYVETTRQPIRAVIDSQFAISEERLLFNGDPVWLFVVREDVAKAERLAQKNVEVIVVPGQTSGGVVRTPVVDKVQESACLDMESALCTEDEAGDVYGDTKHIDLHAVMRVLAERGVNDVHLEAGPRLNGAMLQAGLLDELIVYMAPIIIGPGQGAFALSELNELGDAYRFEMGEHRQIGQDVRLRMRNQSRWQDLLSTV